MYFEISISTQHDSRFEKEREKERENRRDGRPHWILLIVARQLGDSGWLLLIISHGTVIRCSPPLCLTCPGPPCRFPGIGRSERSRLMSEKLRPGSDMEVDVPEENTSEQTAMEIDEDTSERNPRVSGSVKVMASSGTVGSVSISLHPLVIMNVSEHWTRLRAQEGSDQLGKTL